ncbi:MAG: GLUG motif-containing protein, partial [Planctomycetota bacterium]
MSGKKGVRRAALILTVSMVILACAGRSEAKYSGGTGEPNDPYRIATPNDLSDIHDRPEDCNKHFILTADIDMNGLDFNTAVIGWDTHPAQSGFQGTAFTGLFDGRNHSIRNLTIDAGSKDFIGLFGVISRGGQILNLRMEDIRVTGDDGVGALAGSNHSQVNVCHVTGQIYADDYVGGLVGCNDGTVENCTATATVQGDRMVGGLVGESDSATISNCFADANATGVDYVGGLVGYCMYSKFRDCNSIGAVRGTDCVGGLIGWQYRYEVFGCWSAAHVTGNNYVGGLIGKHESARLISSHASGDVEGHDYVGGCVGDSGWLYADCSATGSVAGNDCVGGFAGYADGDFFMCSAKGAVHGHANVGGLFGYADGYSVDSCYAAVNVSGEYGSQNLGGIVGHNAACSISDCYVAGTVEGSSCCGRVVGLNSGSATNCLWDAEIQGVPRAVGCNSGGTVVNVRGENTSAMQDVQTYTAMGWDFAGEMANGADDFWQIPAGGGYPVFGDGRTEWYDWSSNPGNGTAANPYQIATAEQLLSIGWNLELLDKRFVLTSDIDLSGYICRVAPIAPFGLPFTGTFDGRGHEVESARIHGKSSDMFLGLFGTAGHRSLIQDVIVKNASVSGGFLVGGLAGECTGDVTDCHVSGSVSGIGPVGGVLGMFISADAVNLGSRGSVSGSYDVGGLVGYNMASNIWKCCSESSVAGRYAVGGLVGNYTGSLQDSYARGDVTGSDDSERVGGLVGFCERHDLSKVTNCYAAGTVDGNDHVGGLVGHTWPDVVYANCFWDGDVNPDLNSIGNSDDASVIKSTTAQMQTESTFTSAGWDFTTPIWMMCDEPNYPKLWWECPVPPLGVPMKFTPQALNAHGRGNWMKAHFVLPEEFAVEDVDANSPAVV